MADVVRSGAIFRVRDASAVKAPRMSPRPRRSDAAPAAGALSSSRVRRVAVSALEAASSVESARPAASSTRRRSGARTAPGPDTPVGMPKRKARLQQTPDIRSARKPVGLAAAAAGRRTPEEIQASFDQLVMNTTTRKGAAAARRTSVSNNRSDSSGGGALIEKRRTRSQSVSSSSSSLFVSALSVENTPVSAHHHLTRSAAKALRLQHRRYAPAASPASSVATMVLESTEEEPEDDDDDTAVKGKTPPTKRKLQAKRTRAKSEKEESPTSVRSSKRLRAQLRIPTSLPAARSTPITQIGNTEEDEELLQIQKRLVFGSRKPKAQKKQQQQSSTRSRSSNNSTSTSENDSTAEEDDEPVPKRATLPRSSPRKRSDQKQRLSASFSILEDVEALPKSKKTSSVNNQKSASSTSTKKATSRASKSSSTKLVLCEWTLQWPPVYERPDGDSEQKEQLQLVLEGQVLGQDASFQVGRRKTLTQFVSTANEHVELDDCLDVEKAKAWGVPAAVMEIMVEGLPTLWRRKLEAILNNKKVPMMTPRRRNTKASEEEEDSESESEPEEESEPGTKRSRSGRMITPVMDWWRGERLTTDVNGVTVVDRGSPAFIPSERDQTPRKAAAKLAAAMSSSKPPRMPVAPKTPVKAKTPRAKTPVAKAKQEPDVSEWSKEQLQALTEAKMQIPTTATNFWGEVATFVPGKSASECRTKSFEEFASPTGRAAHKKKSSEAAAIAAAGLGSTTKIPTKIHRAGSNLFKKQVRQFVQQYEKKHVDDLFSNTTPSKSELQGTMELDDIKSPAAPMDSSANMDDDDDDFVSGRELLEEISSNKRDEVDSYVLSLKRSRVLGEPTTSYSARTSFLMPSTLKKKAKSMKRAVHMYEEVGSHRMEGVVSPGGTAHVRINKDSDATSDEEDERDSDEEHSSDGF